MVETIKFPTLNEDETFSQVGYAAVQRVYHGVTVNVCSPEFAGGADPTGSKDATDSIQAAVDKVAAAGGGTVVIPAGIYRVSPPFISLKGYVSIQGAGIGSTRIIVDSSKVTANTVENGVFHTGTYEKRVEDPSLFRVCIKDLGIFTSYKNGSLPLGSDGQHQHISAAEHMNDKVWGIVFNTYLLPSPADPDAVHTVENVEIWDTAGGLALLGLDDQGAKLTNIRVRRTWKQGLLVGKPYDHPEAFEVDPSDASKTVQRGGAADNKFVRMDISGANQGYGGWGGIEIYTSQCMFVQCTSWYHRRGVTGAYTGALPTGDTANIWNFSATKETPVAGAKNTKAISHRFLKDGCGWFVAGRDNEFTNCTSQETAGHGWVLAGQNGTYAFCRGESPSFKDTVTGGQGSYGEAAGFVVTNWAHGSVLNGCIVKNAYKQNEAAKVGFYFQSYIKNLRVTDCLTTNMPFKGGVEANGVNNVDFPSNVYENVRISVDEFSYSNLASSSGSPGGGGASGGFTPAAAATTPGELGSLIGHWDFSDQSTITAEAGKVQSVTGATSLQLAQSTAEKQPVVSSLSGRGAIKLARETNQSLTVTLPTVPVATGWTIAAVLAANSATNNQYVLSGMAPGYKNPASVVISSKLGLRANSGGGSAGVTATSPDGALTLYQPAAVIITTTAEGVSLYINGAKSTQALEAKTVADLAGTLTLGTYYEGNNGSDVTVGELVVFSKALTDVEAAGLTAHLLGKWG